MTEYRSRVVMENRIEETCNDWAKEGWEVFSVIVPNPDNYSTYRLTAKRDFAKEPFQESLI